MRKWIVMVFLGIFLVFFCNGSQTASAYNCAWIDGDADDVGWSSSTVNNVACCYSPGDVNDYSKEIQGINYDAGYSASACDETAP
jgi:hypothetical protein